MRARAFAVVALAVGAVAVIGTTLAAAPEATPGPRILVFTKTAGFRHGSIPPALRAVRELGRRNGLTVEATEDAGAFTTPNLRRYEAVVFLLTTGDVLNDGQQRAFERFIRAGGGFAGVHSAADTEYGWAWYGRLLGARFRSHPHIQRGSVAVAPARHPSTAGLPRRWTRTDEWYNFTRSPRPSVRVLATLDEASYSPGEGAMGPDHPIAWSHEFQGGRAWFTGGGHTDESFAEPLFRRHLIGGIRYAAGLSPPRIVSVAAIVRARRLAVTVRYRSCYPCTGQLETGRRTRVSLRFRDGVGRARSARLPRGRSRFSVVLTDPATSLRHRISRSVRVP
jgi:type 1 glutamine amidotransferase